VRPRVLVAVAAAQAFADLTVAYWHDLRALGLAARGR
jgi:hypothetical protein